jgi:hypothetical protein
MQKCTGTAAAVPRVPPYGQASNRSVCRCSSQLAGSGRSSCSSIGVVSIVSTRIASIMSGASLGLFEIGGVFPTLLG